MKMETIKNIENYNYISDMDYKIGVYEQLERIATALEKIAEENGPWKKIVINSEGWRFEK